MDQCTFHFAITLSEKGTHCQNIAIKTKICLYILTNLANGISSINYVGRDQLQQKSYIVFGPRPSLNHPAASKSDESSGRTMLQSSLPAGQSLLKLKIPVSDKSELVFCSPDSRRGQKRKIAEDASSSEADHLFREAAAKTTEKVPDQLFE